MGYSAMQRHELEATIAARRATWSLIATPIDLARVIKIDKPALRVTYEVEELTKPGLAEKLATLKQHALARSRRDGRLARPTPAFPDRTDAVALINIHKKANNEREQTSSRSKIFRPPRFNICSFWPPGKGHPTTYSER